MALILSTAGMSHRHAVVAALAFRVEPTKARPAASAADFNDGAPPGAPVN